MSDKSWKDTKDAVDTEIVPFPVMRGNARMALGAGYFEVPLFSQIEGPLWTGCSPAEFPDELEDVDYYPIKRWAKPVHCHWLWTQTWDDLLLRHVKSSRFDAIVNLYPWEKYARPEGIAYKEVELYDSDDELDDKLIDLLAREVAMSCSVGQTTLVHCQAGLNRSALVAARALMFWKAMTAEQAIKLIRKKRSATCLCNPHFESWLLNREA